MRKIFKRFVAYFIDMLVVTLIVQSLAGVSVINKQLDTYNDYYDEYLEIVDQYGAFKADLVSDFEDKELSEKEYQNLVEDHEAYQDTLDKYYDDGVLSEKEYDKINNKIDEEYQEEYKRISYNLDKNSIVYFVLYLVVVIAYFVFFNKFTGGQTLGKKLLRLKIISSKDEMEVSIWSYVVRMIILYQPISYLVRLIGIHVLSMNSYYTVTSIVSDIQSYLVMLIIMMMMLRMDGRGLQDLLAKTRVTSIDKNGKVIEEVVPTYVEKVLNEKEPKEKKSKEGKPKKKKIIDEVKE